MPSADSRTREDGSDTAAPRCGLDNVVPSDLVTSMTRLSNNGWVSRAGRAVSAGSPSGRAWMIGCMERRYVALGDSMSIDDYAGGPGRGAASLLHRNRDADFPDWTGRDLAHAGFAARVLATDGATARDVLVEQLPLIDAPPDLVTITMG